jgi:tRNA dimethylallyltransferase
MVSTPGVTPSSSSSQAHQAAPLTAVLSGPTATGKTEIALEFIRRRKARGQAIEIINADSMLVYRSMDIGTAKPSTDEMREIPHHLINICEPSEVFTAGDFSKKVIETLERLQAEGKRALIVGGSGFYLKALLYGLWEGAPADPATRTELEKISSPELYEKLYARDSQAALRIGVNDRYRLVRAHELMTVTGKTPSELQAEQNQIPNPALRLLVVDRPNEELYERIERRTSRMLEVGLLDEVRSVRSRFPRSRALGAVGYAQVCDYLDGIAPAGRKISSDEKGLREEITLATRQLVKKQRTWFRGEKYSEHFELPLAQEKLLARLEELYL